MFPASQGWTMHAYAMASSLPSQAETQAHLRVRGLGTLHTQATLTSGHANECRGVGLGPFLEASENGLSAPLHREKVTQMLLLLKRELLSLCCWLIIEDLVLKYIFLHPCQGPCHPNHSSGERTAHFRAFHVRAHQGTAGQRPF